jgi:hypothetical protein
LRGQKLAVERGGGALSEQQGVICVKLQDLIDRWFWTS